MKIAALYDIHGNLPALEAVLQEMLAETVDQIVVGGDVVSGPMPRETLDCLLNLSLPVHFLRGNADREVMDVFSGADVDAIPESERENAQWVAAQMPSAHIEQMRRWPETLRLNVGRLGDALFCHATPRSDTELVTHLTPSARFDALFKGFEVPLIVCGHTHMQHARIAGYANVVNAGSVGMAYGEPGAYWLLLDGDTSDIAFRRTDFDQARAAERIRATNYPQARSFADENVLTFPTEADALSFFASLEPPA